MKLHSFQLLVLRLALGGLFLSVGLEKINEGWITNSEHLLQSLNNYHQHASSGAQLTYLTTVALPYVGLWAKLMAIGETAVAASLLLGLLVRLSSFIAIFMVLNFHAANGNLFSINFFGSPWAALLVAGLLAVFLARAGRWAGIDAWLAKSNAKGVLW